MLNNNKATKQAVSNSYELIDEKVDDLFADMLNDWGIETDSNPTVAGMEFSPAEVLALDPIAYNEAKRNYLDYLSDNKTFVEWGAYYLEDGETVELIALLDYLKDEGDTQSIERITDTIADEWDSLDDELAAELFQALADWDFITDEIMEKQNERDTIN